MAKKKTAPVLRSQGEQPTPETPIITKSYSVRDDWKDKNIVNYVAFKSVDGEVQDLTVNGEPAGGGGGGDFSTANVQIINNNSELGVSVQGPILLNNMIMADMTYRNVWSTTQGSSASYTVPLASNGTQFFASGIPLPGPTITGDCIWDADANCFIITGNCTITA